MDALIAVDARVGLLSGAPKHGLQGINQRINSLTAMVRKHFSSLLS